MTPAAAFSNLALISSDANAYEKYSHKDLTFESQ